MEYKGPSNEIANTRAANLKMATRVWYLEALYSHVFSVECDPTHRLLYHTYAMNASFRSAYLVCSAPSVNIICTRWLSTADI